MGKNNFMIRYIIQKFSALSLSLMIPLVYMLSIRVAEDGLIMVSKVIRGSNPLKRCSQKSIQYADCY